MFCQNCGQRIHPGTLFCTGCGFRLAYAQASAAVALPRTLPEFSGFNSASSDDLLKRPFLVSLFAILYIAAAVGAFFNGFFTFASGVYVLVNQGTSAASLTGVALGLLYLLFGSLWWLTGTGLWNLKPNARITHMILSAFSILTLFGAPIAVLVFWYFTRPEIKILFSGKSEFELTPYELQTLANSKKSNATAVVIGAVITIVVIVGGFLATIVVTNMKSAIERGKQKRTMADLRAIGTAVESYAVDHGSYPAVSNIEQLASTVEPQYIHQLPRKDSWDHEFQYIGWSLKGNKGPEFYRIASAGKDGILELNDLRIYEVKSTQSAESDIVFGGGTFIQFPDGIVR